MILKHRLLLQPIDPAYAVGLRHHEGIPSIAVSPVNGRLWATWYASNTGCEDANNYVVLSTSANGGETWREVAVYDPDPGGPVRAFDPELWIAPDGLLRWTWTERTCPQDAGEYAGVAADPSGDRLMMAMLSAEDEPAAEEAGGASPRPFACQIARGVMMCKPTVLADGTWLFPVAHWGEAPSASVYASLDGGRTFEERGGITLPQERRLFDEHQIVELRNGTLRAYIRTKGATDCLWEAESSDGGRTWGEPRPSALPHVSSRVFVRRLASGNLLLVKNGAPGDTPTERRDMTAYLSDDDGKTWPHTLVLDAGRAQVSYPDGQQLPDGRIVVAYDYDRVGSRQILFATFREEDVIAGFFKAPGSRSRRTIHCGDPEAPGRAQAPIDVSIGRQLFVDDHLVAEVCGVVRHWNKPVKREDPVVWPGVPGAVPAIADGFRDPLPGDEAVNLTCATDGGLWWDPSRRLFRLWYQADWLGNVCYAESEDGLAWRYPDLGIVAGTNRLLMDERLDSWSVTPDYAAPDPYAAWKMHISSPGGVTDDTLYESDDGIRFRRLGPAGRSGDRSTSFYDPFRGVWVFSLRDFNSSKGRFRRRFTSGAFGGPGCRWRWPSETVGEEASTPVPPVWPITVPAGERRSLYSFNAVAYESLMLGVQEVLYNTPGDNGDSARVGLPKQTALHFCFSRDGTVFTTPRAEADIAPEGWGSGKWDTGYLAATGGICVIRDERLWFYYSGLRGDGERLATGNWMKRGGEQRNGMYSNGSIGVATLRRDGFAGMVADGRGELVTKPLVFDGAHLFVNAECRFGSVAAEILGEDGRAIPGFSLADCAPFARGDSTKTELRFAGGDLSRLARRAVSIRFHLHCATLYAFWISPSERGESRGFVAGGGPAYGGLRDTGTAPRQRRGVRLGSADGKYALSPSFDADFDAQDTEVATLFRGATP